MVPVAVGEHHMGRLERHPSDGERRSNRHAHTGHD